MSTAEAVCCAHICFFPLMGDTAFQKLPITGGVHEDSVFPNMHCAHEWALIQMYVCCMQPICWTYTGLAQGTFMYLLTVYSCLQANRWQSFCFPFSWHAKLQVADPQFTKGNRWLVGYSPIIPLTLVICGNSGHLLSLEPLSVWMCFNELKCFICRMPCLSNTLHGSCYF